MPTYILLSSNVLASNTASVTFSSIPNTYTDLLVRFSARSNSAGVYDSVLLTLNSDTGNNYRINTMFDYAPNTPNPASQSGPTTYGFANGNGAAANFYGNSQIHIPNYATTSTRQISWHSVTENNATDSTFNNNMANGYYTGTTAISTLKLNPQTGTLFLATSSFYLYGIKSS